MNLDKYIKPPNLIVEKGEYVQDAEGKVMKVSPNMPSHDDKTLVGIKADKKVNVGKGGVELENIVKVVAATGNPGLRKKSDPTFTNVDASIQFAKQEAIDFIKERFNLNPSIRQSLSPAKVIDKTLEAKEKFAKKFKLTGELPTNKFAENTLLANKATMSVLPSLEDVFEQVFQQQEAKKIPVNPEEQYAQVGSIQDYGLRPVISDRYTFKKKVPTKEELLADQTAIAAEKKAIIDARKKNIATANSARNNKSFTAENIANETGAIGDKMRMFPEDSDSFFDDYINPGVMIGDLASGIGRIPKNIQNGNYGKAALDLAIPATVGLLGGIGAKTTGQFINNMVNPLAGVSKGFKSEINWSNWNKEIPDNTQLMKEYGAIEQTTKAKGTWMKNSDGSVFQGKPEQFVQQNSSNFKKAFPEGSTTAYRGARENIADFKNRDAKHWATFLTDNIDNAKSYGADRYGDVPTFFHPDKDYNFQQQGLYEMHIPNNVPKITGDARGRSWRLVDDNPNLNTKNIGFLDKENDYYKKLYNNPEEDLSSYGLSGYDPLKRYATTDAYAQHVKNVDNPEAVSEIKNVIDTMGDGYTKPTTVYAVDSERVNLKSKLYNNGMFDMNNPNIYKSLIPGAALGTAAINKQTGGTASFTNSELFGADNTTFKPQLKYKFLLQQKQDLDKAKNSMNPKAEQQFRDKYGISSNQFRREQEPGYAAAQEKAGRLNSHTLKDKSTNASDYVAPNNQFMFPNLSGSSQANMTNQTNDLIAEELLGLGAEGLLGKTAKKIIPVKDYFSKKNSMTELEELIENKMDSFYERNNFAPNHRNFGLTDHVNVFFDENINPFKPTSEVKRTLSSRPLEQQQRIFRNLYNSEVNFISRNRRLLSDLQTNYRTTVPNKPVSYFEDKPTTLVKTPLNNFSSLYSPPSDPINKSRITKQELQFLNRTEDLTKMKPEFFENSVLKPDNTIASYVDDDYVEQKLKQQKIPLHSQTYSNIFNNNIDRLNEIISKNNKSGYKYEVDYLTNDGSLNFKSYLKGEDSPENVKWNVGIRPGRWEGPVEELDNKLYYSSIPGLNMENTTSSVFSDGTPRRGTKAYESINEYLKELDLGRVKPGFNSQTTSSKGLWKNIVNNKKGYGYMGDKNTVYGIMKSLLPAAGLTTAAINQKQTGGEVDVDSVLNANKHLNFVKRFYDPNRKSIMIPEQNKPSTHFMESADGMVYPTVVEIDGKLQYLGDKAYEHAIKTKEFIKLKNDKEAQWFGENYKKGTNILKQQGGKTKIKSEPYMKGSRPALGTTSGKSIEVLDGKTISMDTIYDTDSVSVKGNEGKTFYSSKLSKYIKK